MSSHSQPSTNIQSADIQWEDGLPISTRFNDVYFSRVSGIAETRHVFLDHNRLMERFQALTPGATFTIGETGFGTGLNFLCAWQLFLTTAPAPCTLHFISTEKYPLLPKDLQQALALFTELKPLADELIRAYHLGDHSIDLHFSAGQKHIHLQVLLGDAQKTLPTITEAVDAWFLDGFAPAKNPQMWQPQLFQTLKSKSHNTTTYATFTAARVVRDGLQQAGFSVTKQPGFGRKRDMLAGQWHETQPDNPPKPWFSPTNHNNPDKTAIVVGGGLAGCSAAWSLARRGWQVTILEQHQHLANEASGNPQGVLYAKLSANNTPLSQFILAGYRYTLDCLQTLSVSQWQQCGVIQLAIDDKTARRYQALDKQHPDELLNYLNAEQLSDICGINVPYAGLYFPQAGWVHPPALCRALAEYPNIQVITQAPVNKLTQTDQGWLLSAGQKHWHSKTVIVAQGANSQQFDALSHLPLKSIRGQITEVKATAATERLKSCVCGEGYVAPPINGIHTLGATFSFKDNSTAIREADHRENLTMQAKHFPAFFEALGGDHADVVGGRVGFRCTTADYLPVVGPIVDSRRFINTYGALRKNSKQPLSAKPDYMDGLYVTAGHGSRGTLSCPIAGEILATMISGEPMDDISMPTHLLAAIHPSRFLIRDLIRNKI